MKLLIVDDHAGMRAMIRQLAELPAAAVRECASGEEAIEAVREFVPDIVTMDVRLPGLTGLEATRAIRLACPGVRIVIVSAYDLVGLRVAAGQAGAMDFVPKDDLERLRSTLARCAASNPNSGAAPAATDEQER